MLRYATPRRLRPLLAVTAFALTFAPVGLPASAQQAATKHVPAKLVCGSHSADRKKLTPFQVELTFNVSGSLWLIDRKTSRRPGEEKFLGILVAIRNDVDRWRGQGRRWRDLDVRIFRSQKPEWHHDPQGQSAIGGAQGHPRMFAGILAASTPALRKRDFSLCQLDRAGSVPSGCRLCR